MDEVVLRPDATAGFAEVLGDEARRDLDAALTSLRLTLGARRVWHVNSTAQGGGVAEILASVLPYALGAGIATGWLVVAGSPDFFAVTKRIHNWLHDDLGDGGELGPGERALYDAHLRGEAGQVQERVTPGDVVVLHDPQTAGLVPALQEHGVHIVWRCHVGNDAPGELSRRAQEFLRPDVVRADMQVFSRQAHIWDGLDPARTFVMPPCIDVLSPKNRPLTEPERDALLQSVALDLSGKVVLQVSRWDRLKDHLGVLRAFVEHGPARLDGALAPRGADLVLAGPAVDGVTDDPESTEAFAELRHAWSELADEPRRHVHLAPLPMDDLAHNARLVNALQRRADVVVQKSLAEGFGLTVAEAMWKERPVVASRIGGIQDQIVHGDSGILLDDPSDLAACGAAINSLLLDPEKAQRIGRAACRRVRENFLLLHHFRREDLLFGRLLHHERLGGVGRGFVRTPATGIADVGPLEDHLDPE